MVSLWRAGAKFALLASTIGSGAAAATIASSDDPEAALKLCTTVPRRLLRDALTAANIAFGTIDLTELHNWIFILVFNYKLVDSYMNCINR